MLLGPETMGIRGTSELSQSLYKQQSSAEKLNFYKNKNIKV